MNFPEIQPGHIAVVTYTAAFTMQRFLGIANSFEEAAKIQPKGANRMDEYVLAIREMHPSNGTVAVRTWTSYFYYGKISQSGWKLETA